MRTLIFLFLALFLAPLAAAQDPQTEAANAAAEEILTEDAALQQRLNGVFTSTEALSDITAEVSNGVVTLSGDVQNESQASRAVTLAEGFDGALIVQDNINRTLEVRGNLGTVLKSGFEDLKSLVRALPLLLVGLLIIILFWWLGGALSRRKSFWNKLAPNPFLAELLSQTGRVLLIAIGVVIALNLVGASSLVAAVLGGAGVLGIAIGFAVRDTLENYFASIMLSLRQPFRSGDHVLIDSHEGKVMRLTSRATILMTLDGNHLRIPNSTVFKSIILNYSTNTERRFQFELGIDAADDPVAAMKSGLDVMRSNSFVMDNPAPSAIITNVGDSNIVIRFQGWVDQEKADFGKARSLSIRAVKNALEEQGFSLPEPIYRVKLDNMSGTQLDLTTGAKAKPKPKAKPSDLDMDVAPDTTIDRKVEAELDEADDNNLLDESKPTE